MKIIYLTGPSSVGKTTLAKALQEALDKPFLHMSFDKVIGMKPLKINNWTGGSSLLGFSWESSYDDEGILIQKLKKGPFAKKIQSAFRDLSLKLVESGHHLIIDDFSLDKESFEVWKELNFF